MVAPPPHNSLSRFWRGQQSPNSVEGNLKGDLESLWVPGVPSVRDPFEAPSKLRYFFSLLENNVLSFCRANHPIIVKVWLHFGALVGYPLCAIVLLHFLMQFLIRKHVFFWLQFSRNWKLHFCVLQVSSYVFHVSSYGLYVSSIFLTFPAVVSCFLHFSLCNPKSQCLKKCNITFGGIWIL